VFSHYNVYILQLEKGEAYILTRQMHAVLRPYQNLGLDFAWLEYFASHHAN